MGACCSKQPRTFHAQAADPRGAILPVDSYNQSKADFGEACVQLFLPAWDQSYFYGDDFPDLKLRDGYGTDAVLASVDTQKFDGWNTETKSAFGEEFCAENSDTFLLPTGAPWRGLTHCTEIRATARSDCHVDAGAATKKQGANNGISNGKNGGEVVVSPSDVKPEHIDPDESEKEDQHAHQSAADREKKWMLNNTTGTDKENQAEKGHHKLIAVVMPEMPFTTPYVNQQVYATRPRLTSEETQKLAAMSDEKRRACLTNLACAARDGQALYPWARLTGSDGLKMQVALWKESGRFLFRDQDIEGGDHDVTLEAGGLEHHALEVAISMPGFYENLGTYEALDSRDAENVTPFEAGEVTNHKKQLIMTHDRAPEEDADKLVSSNEDERQRQKTLTTMSSANKSELFLKEACYEGHTIRYRTAEGVDPLLAVCVHIGWVKHHRDAPTQKGCAEDFRSKKAQTRYKSKKAAAKQFELGLVAEARQHLHVV